MRALSMLSNLFTSWASLVKNRPLVVNCLTGATLCAASDTLAQRLERDESLQCAKEPNFSIARVTFAGVIGALVGGVVYPRAYAQLDRIWTGTNFSSVLQKSLVEIATVGIFVNSLSIGCRGVFSGKSPEEVARHLGEEMPRVTLNDARVWLPYNLVAFSVIPPVLRPSTTALMEASWQTYISLRSHDYKASTITAE